MKSNCYHSLKKSNINKLHHSWCLFAPKMWFAIHQQTDFAHYIFIILSCARTTSQNLLFELQKCNISSYLILKASNCWYEPKKTHIVHTDSVFFFFYLFLMWIYSITNQYLRGPAKSLTGFPLTTHSWLCLLTNMTNQRHRHQGLNPGSLLQSTQSFIPSASLMWTIFLLFLINLKSTWV